MPNAKTRLEEDLSPEELDQVTANMTRHLAVTGLRAGGDPETLIEQIDEAARLAEAGNEPDLAAYLRAVAMVVNGDEPEEVPAAFRDHVEAVRKATQKGGNS